MTNNELTTLDVLNDNTKNFCSIYTNDDDDDDHDPLLTLTDSLYHTETEFVELVRSNNFKNGENLTIISINIANLLSKLRSFQTFLNNIKTGENKPDIIVVTETHISRPENLGFTPADLRNILPDYDFFHKGRSSKKGGGVGIFVIKALSSEINILNQVNSIDEQFENIVIHIPNIIKSNNEFLNKDLVIAAIYRPPNNDNHDTFLQEFEKLLSATDKRKHELIIAGDLNLDLLKYEHHLPTANYIDLLTQHGLLPRIVRPTRIKKQSATLIDHILTKNNK